MEKDNNTIFEIINTLFSQIAIKHNLKKEDIFLQIQDNVIFFLIQDYEDLIVLDTVSVNDKKIMI